MRRCCYNPVFLGADTIGAISHNEIGWRGEHPAAPDGCAIDYEGESSGVNVTDNFIHDSVRFKRTSVLPIRRCNQRRLLHTFTGICCPPLWMCVV